MIQPKRETDFSHQNFFAFRTPLLPFEEFLRWSEGLQAPKVIEDSSNLESALAADRMVLRGRLREVIGRSEIREAIFVASPDLDSSINLWLREPESHKGQRTERALVRYFARMTGRPTPFGLFAGSSVGTIGRQARLVVTDRTKYQRHTRLDADYLSVLIDKLVSDVSLRHIFEYRPNTSLYRMAGHYRYHEARLQEKVRSYHLVEVEETDALSQTLDRAEDGSTFRALANALVNEDVSIQDAEAFLHELIASQILVPQIPFPVHGPEPIQAIIDELHKHPDTQHISSALTQAWQKLAKIDTNGLGVGQESYREVTHCLEGLPAKVELARLFQVDLVKPSPEACLDEAVVHKILKGVEVLYSINRTKEDSALKDFRTAFTARYDTREVPLLEALDEEAGIGFQAAGETAPLLRDLPFRLDPSEESVTWDKQDNFLLGRLGESLRTGAEEILLTEADLETLRSDAPLPLPDAFAVDAVLGPNKILLASVYGPSGARLLGRFCHAEPDLQKHVQQHLRSEEALHTDAVIAEIVHLPEGRLGNVLCRPAMREYEIPYLGFSCAAPEHQIPVTSLLVSVRGERIFLRSSRLNREVIPRMTNAHNYSLSSLGVYRFLCDLQDQNVSQDVGWNWGALRNAPYLPRIVYDSFVFSRARWRICKEELKQLNNLSGAKLFQAVQSLRKRLHLPRIILLADLDNRLPVDLENMLSVETFVHLIKRREAATLIEFYPAADQLCAHGPEGKFVHELIIPFVRSKDAKNEHPANQTRPADVERSFPPGSEWLYFKLYTGATEGDSILQQLNSVIQGLSASNAIDHWFFIRYQDPDWHLRLRFHGVPKVLHSKTLPALQKAVLPLLKEGSIWRIQIDTYEREVERYGGKEGILLAEQIFHVDSECVLETLEQLEPGDEGLQERWQLALRGIDLMLEDFGLNPRAKLSAMQKAKEGLSKEFRLDAEFKRKLAEKFRKERKGLESLFAVPSEDHPLSLGLRALQRRSSRIKRMIGELRKLEEAKRLSISIDELAPSYIHMHVNRLLRSAQREQELVLYDFLVSLYQSHASRRLEHLA